MERYVNCKGGSGARRSLYTLRKALAETGKGAAGLRLPPSCIMCGGRALNEERISFRLPCDVPLCRRCLMTVVPYPKDRRFLPLLSQPYEGDELRAMPLYMPFPYDGFFRKAIPLIKFSGKRELAVFSGCLLGSIMKSDHVTGDLIVPVPLSGKRLRERGFNQASVIAHQVSEITGIPVIDNVLMRTRETGRQTEIISSEERSANVADAFEADPSMYLENNRILLIDDVATTGNTMHEAAAALIRAGADEVIPVALCGNRNIRNDEPY